MTRRPKKPLPPPARVTPQTAFNNLLRKSQSQQPHALCRLLEEAVLDNRVRAWRNGVLMSPQELRGYYVHIEQEADGRWACTIKPQGLHRIKARIVNVWETEDGRQMMTLAHPEDHWELDRVGVQDILAPQKRKQRPGKKPKGNWPDLIDQELHRIGRNRAQELHNSGELRETLKQFLKRKIGWSPADPKPLNTIIRAFLAG